MYARDERASSASRARAREAYDFPGARAERDDVGDGGRTKRKGKETIKSSRRMTSTTTRALARAVFASTLRDARALATIARDALGTMVACDDCLASWRAHARRKVFLANDDEHRVEETRDGTSEGRDGTGTARERATGASNAWRARARYQGDWLDFGGENEHASAREAIERWGAAPFEPYAGRGKDVKYCAATARGGARRGREANESERRGVEVVLREISREYEGNGLGRHVSIAPDDEGALFVPRGDEKTSAERYATALSRAASAAAEASARAPTTCVIYVVIEDDCDEVDALAVLALASHVASAAMRSVERCFLSVTIQALPASWCDDSYSWSPKQIRAMAFNCFLKSSRPTVTHRRALDDELDEAPKSFTDTTRTDGRVGVTGAAVVGRRPPHPFFKILETPSGRRAPSFPAYEPLYVLRKEAPTAAAKESMDNVFGLHCAYVVVANRWIVAAWSDANGEFLNLEAEPFAVDEVVTAGISWLVDRTSALAEQLEFAYGETASADLKFNRSVICRMGTCASELECDELLRQCSTPPAPLEPNLVCVQMKCFEPDVAPPSVATATGASKDISYVTTSNDSTGAVKTYAFPPTHDTHRAVYSANVSSIQLVALANASRGPVDVATLRYLSTFYASRLSQLGMMCASEIAVDASGSVRAPLPIHAEVCVNLASSLQTIEANAV